MLLASISDPHPHTHLPRRLITPPTPQHAPCGLGWHRRCKTLYVYWGWRWLATTL